MWDTERQPQREELDVEYQRVARVARRVIPLVLGVIVALWLISGVYIVGPEEQGVVRRFGKVVDISGPGPHYRLPWPIDAVDIPKVLQVKRIEIGFRTVSAGPPAQYRFLPEESLMLTGDENIVDAQLIVQYRIRDAYNYLFKIKDPEGTLRDAAEAALRQIIGRTSIDDALTVGKAQIQEDTRQLLQDIMDRYNSGLLITVVKLQTVQPPAQVDAAFKDVVSAREDRDRLVNEALGYQEDVMPKARGQAEQVKLQAAAYKEQRIRRAEGDAQRFLEILREYKEAKDVTRKRLYLETMEEILPNIKKFIIDPKVGGGLLQFLPLEATEAPPEAGSR